MKKIKTPLEDRIIKELKVGQMVLLSGFIYTARDQAHKRLNALIRKRQSLPVDLKGQVIYYCGPSATPKGRIIGSCGPTTSSRMDEYTGLLLKNGLKGMIGKGSRDKKAISLIKQYRAVYFLTYAGCAALLSQYVKKVKLCAFKELGPEAIYRLEVKDFPLIVGVDSRADNVYKNLKD